METTEQYTMALDERGRLVLPAPLRRRLDLAPGARMIATIDADHAIHVVLAREQARRLFGLVPSSCP
jgi:bifunctional DNA-binding transcriptional regulator/antitoxin component of YhaV-PrlF toxin-antitoxin module